MFESEDFDLDEDFLNDIGKKEEEYYSQQIETENSRASKRRKTEVIPKPDKIIEDDFASDIIFDDEPDFARLTSKSECSYGNDGNSNLQLQKESPEGSKSKQGFTANEKESKSNQISSKDKENIEISRKNLALEILRKGLGSGDKKLNEEKSNLSLGQSFKGASSEIASSSNTSNEAHQRVLLECFKKPAARDKPSPKLISKDRSVAPRIPLVRKFPGPAGLLPDCPELNLESVNFLNVCGREVDEDHDDGGISEYLSQNTERLFSSGAWRLMLDDLPENFLRGHDISTIKRASRNNSRISFLAGVIQRIDHSMENPRLVLKDLSDSIEGTMHRDIPLAHPNTFEPGVVILLRNAGVLEFRAAPNSSRWQFHIMIAPKNVLAVYSDKSRLVASPAFESLLVNSSGRMERSGEDSANNSIADNIDISDFEIDEEDDAAFARFDIDGMRETTSHSSVSSVMKNDGGERDDSPRTETRVEIHSEHGSSEKTIKSPSERMEIEIRPKAMGTVRSRLMQFKSIHDPRPEVVEKPCETSPKDSDNSQDDSKGVLETTGFGNDLLDSDNDTEDEILSQLDIDSIVTSYNSATR